MSQISRIFCFILDCFPSFAATNRYYVLRITAGSNFCKFYGTRASPNSLAARRARTNSRQRKRKLPLPAGPGAERSDRPLLRQWNTEQRRVELAAVPAESPDAGVALDIQAYLVRAGLEREAEIGLCHADARVEADAEIVRIKPVGGGPDRRAGDDQRNLQRR